MAPQTTHEVCVGDAEVFKRYKSVVHGEDQREFDALTVLAEHAPGLAPTPLQLRREDGRIELQMSRIAGRPLGDDVLSAIEVGALARAMTRLHDSVPPSVLRSWPLRLGVPTELLDGLRAGLPPSRSISDVVVAEAARASRRWLETSGEATVATFPRRRVFTNADGNLSNYLWDGRECRIVDFEDAGVSDWAYEVADLLEHPTVALTHAFLPDGLLELMDADDEDLADLRQYRRLLASVWFVLLLPDGPAAPRNPPGSLHKQARRVVRLLQS